MQEPSIQEKHFQNYIIDRLVDQGWKLGKSKYYDKERALYPEDIEAWMKNGGQKDKWDKLEKTNGDRTIEVIMNRLDTELQNHGTSQVIRKGFSLAGSGEIKMTETAPEDKRSPVDMDRYKANILRVVPELKYHPTREFAIDLVFFINGLAVATVELKSNFNQSVEDAMNQYKTDRLPVESKTRRKEPLLTFKRGAIVHFAMSETEIMMTTKLDGDKTFFLPFNKGNQGRAGNPPGEKKADGSQEYSVAYFWEEICQPDAWLRIFHNFVYVDKRDVTDINGIKTTKETQIFPRFHQFAAVNSMIADAKKNGPGMNYLADHSAGSGKTSTISWTAHDLIRLREDNGKAVFNNVIIVSDRNVLDGQLQDAVQQIEHSKNSIVAIDRQKSSKSKSQQLSDALIGNTPIIVVTIQTFPYAMEAIITDDSLKDKNFAVIIDEAHNSQTGSIASKLHSTLSMTSEEDMANLTTEDLIEKIQNSRSRENLKNISYFAFTGTPKHQTITLFGRVEDPTQPESKSNPKKAFHTYTMRQAMDEGFIIDVMQGYLPYKTAFNLSKEVEDIKREQGRSAKRALAQWMSLHPTNVTQKVQFIIEHFAENVAHLLNGEAKAMVVTSSRAAAIRYKKAFDKYIEHNTQYQFIKSLVAFSGKVTGKQLIHYQDDDFKDLFMIDEEEEFTEYNLNPGAQGKDLRFAFDDPQFKVMIVANKFQTGFDQPKLVAMYVDKKIANPVEIVQTFSRLNRTTSGKDKVFIIDFVNDPVSVKKAFALYDSGAELEDIQDANIVYDIKRRLDDHRFYNDQDLELFKQARFKTIKDITTQSKNNQHKNLNTATNNVVNNYTTKMKELRYQEKIHEQAYLRARDQGNKDAMKEIENQKEHYSKEISKLMSFKADLARFNRAYSYVTQLIEFDQPELEVFYAFSKILFNRLSNASLDSVDLKGLLLKGYEITQREVEVPKNEKADTLKPIGSGVAAANAEKLKFMKEIIEAFNTAVGEVGTPIEQLMFLNQIAIQVRKDPTTMAQIDNNSKEQAMKGNLSNAVQRAVIKVINTHQKQATQVLKLDSQGKKHMEDLIYEVLTSNSIDLSLLNNESNYNSILDKM